MLTVREAADRVHRHPETVRRWIRSGRLRARKLGAQHVIDEADLATLTDDRYTPVPEPWKTTITGEPMPDILAALDRVRAGR